VKTGHENQAKRHFEAFASPGGRAGGSISSSRHEGPGAGGVARSFTGSGFREVPRPPPAIVALQTLVFCSDRNRVVAGYAAGVQICLREQKMDAG